MLSLQHSARHLSRSAVQLISSRAGAGTRHHQGEGFNDPAAAFLDGGAAADASAHLYSLGAEVQELAYLHSMAAVEYSAAEARRAAEREEAAAATDRLLPASEAPVEVRWGSLLLMRCSVPSAQLSWPADHSAWRYCACPQPLAASQAGHIHTAAPAEDDGLCEVCCHDFYESFDSERQLILRSSWLCAGAGSLRDIRRRLE